MFAALFFLPLFAAPAVAAPVSWTFGSLQMPRANDNALGGLGDEKSRLFDVPLPGLRDTLTLHSWISVPATPGQGLRASGFLIDVPLGNFRITPSIGAGLPDHLTYGEAPSLQIRSQLEIGYEFDDHSRFAVGFSRSSGEGGRFNNDPDDVFALYYRIPLGW